MEALFYSILTALVILGIVSIEKRMQGTKKEYKWQRCIILVVIGISLMSNGCGSHWLTDIRFLAGVICIIGSIVVGFRKESRQ